MSGFILLAIFCFVLSVVLAWFLGKIPTLTRVDAQDYRLTWTWQGWITLKGEKMLPGVQAASLATHEDGDAYRVELDTTDGQVPLHGNSYSGGKGALKEHQRLAERVNAFLQDPTAGSMTFDPGLGTRLGPALISLVIGAVLLFGAFFV